MEENKSLPQVKYCKRLILLHLKHITLKSVKRCSKTYRNRSILGEVCKINRKLQHRFIKKVMEIYVYFFSTIDWMQLTYISINIKRNAGKNNWAINSKNSRNTKQKKEISSDIVL